MRYLIIVLFILFRHKIALAQKAPVATATDPIHQLRIYGIPEDNRQVFNERFRDHAIRIMKKYDFKIVAIWESAVDDKLEFIYLLEWENEAQMKKAWENFMADQEWKDIKAATSQLHGTFVNSIEEKSLILTDYSPQKTLFK